MNKKAPQALVGIQNQNHLLLVLETKYKGHPKTDANAENQYRISLSVSQNCFHKTPCACAVNYDSTRILSTTDASGPTHTHAHARTHQLPHTIEGISVSAPASSSSRTHFARPNSAAKLSAVCLHCASDAQNETRKQSNENERKKGEREIACERRRQRERRHRNYKCQDNTSDENGNTTMIIKKL